ncbi:MAG: enoyl-CoA hydratase-related protein, partial [Pseudomonadota bacterium]
LVESGVAWPNHPCRPKFSSDGFGDINSAEGLYLSSNDTNWIFNRLRLGEEFSENHSDFGGELKFPYPQAGRHSDGNPKNFPSNDKSEDLWKDYINYVKNLSGTYKKKYGYRTLMNYMLQNNQMKWNESEDLWRTSHYPFHAVKNGASLFLQFLDDLDFGDEIGLVSYVWPDADFMDRALTFAGKIARGAPLSNRFIKRTLNQGLDTDLWTHLDQISSHIAVVRSSEDHLEAIRAFKEKRPPVFKGR